MDMKIIPNPAYQKARYVLALSLNNERFFPIRFATLKDARDFFKEGCTHAALLKYAVPPEIEVKE